MQEVTTFPYSPITGNGLGSCYSSLSKVGSILPQKGLGAASLEFFPNLSNGNLFFKDRILNIVQPSFTLSLGFVYNSQATDPTKAWKFNHKRFTQLPPTTPPPGGIALLEEADGHLTTYAQLDPHNPSIFYYAQESVNGTKFMRFDETQKVWILHNPDSGIVEYYDLQGLLRKRTDVEGRATLYEYDNNQQLFRITTPTQNHYEIRRNGGAIGIYDADHNQELQSYYFDAKNRLITSSTSDGFISHYSYKDDNSSLIDTVLQTDGTQVLFTYTGANNAVQMITTGKGMPGSHDPSTSATARITYADNTHPNQAWIQDSFNIRTTVTYNQNNDMTQVKRQNGYDNVSKITDDTNYTYKLNNQLDTITRANGGIEHRDYDAAHNNVLKLRTEPDGQQTENVYLASGETTKLVCNVHYINSTTPVVTRYVYEEIDDGVAISLFLRFKISPEGRVTEYRRLPNDPNRNIDSERTYLDTFLDVSHFEKDFSPSIETMQDWVTLQKPHWDRVSLKTYGYDLNGQLFKITRFTDVDKQGNGIQNAGTGLEYTYRNIFGSTTQTQITTSTETAITDQSYDDLQRITRTVDALKNQKKYTYLDAQSQIQVTSANGKVNVQNYNPRGLVLSDQTTAQNVKKENETRNTQYLRDVGGRISVTTLPDTSQLYSYYDRQNRLGYTVTSLGIVTEYQYDAQNRFNAQIRYDQKVNIQDLWIDYPPPPGIAPSASALVRALKKLDPTKNRTTYTFFDKSGRRTYKVDARNFVTQYFYDNLNRRVATIVYSTALTEAQLNLLTTGQTLTLVPDFTKDTCVRSFWDKDGLLIGKQDAAGYITQFTRDAGGRITQRSLYYTKAPLDLSLSFAALLQPLQGTKVGNTVYTYDARGQVLSEVNPEGYRIEHTYSPNGLRLTTTRIATDPTLNQTTTYHYDLLGRAIQTDSPFNRVDGKSFDSMGNLLQSKVIDSSAPDNLKFEADYLRQTQTQYDGWNQSIRNANAYVGELLAKANGDPAKINEIWETKSQRNTFDSTGLKLYSTDPKGFITYFYYDTDRRPIVVICADGSVEESTLDSFGDEIVNRKYKNAIPTNNLTGGVITPAFRAVLNALQDNKDQIKQFGRNKRGEVETYTDARANITQKTFTALGQVDTELLPVNSQNPTLEIKHGYDTRGNETSTTKTDTLTNAVIVETHEFENPLNKETKHVNEIGGVYKNEHDFLGNVTVEKSDDVIRNTFTYDFISRVQTKTDAEGNIENHKYLADHKHTVISANQEAQLTSQLNVFNEVTQTTDALKNTTSKTHAPDGQVRTLTDPLGNITAQGFDLLGQKEKHVDALNVETAFGYTEIGDVKKISNNAASDKPQSENFTRNAFGNAEQEVDPMGVVTKNEFNESNLLHQKTKDVGGLGLTETYEHNAQGTQISFAQGDVNNLKQYVEQNLVDGFNRAVGKVVDPNNLALATNLGLDAAGNVTSETDPNRHKTYHYFDELKKPRFTVTPTGGVRETNYDKNNRIQYERVYDTAFVATDTTTLSQLETFASQNATTEDGLLYYFYDANGNEKYRVNSLGAVSEFKYNNASPQAVVEDILYFTKIDASKLNPSLSTAGLEALISASPKDRKTIYVRDGKGQATRKIDGENYVTDQVFNALGKPTVITRYANKVNQPTDDPVKDPFNDRMIYFVYDKLNRKVFEVETFDMSGNTGRVTKFDYDANNNPTQTCKFAEKFVINSDYNTMVRELNQLLPVLNKDNIEVQTFDNANRLKRKTDGLGYFEELQPNALSLVESHTDKAGYVWGAKFDAAKRRTHKIYPKDNVVDIVKNITNGVVSLSASQNEIAIEDKTDFYADGKPQKITKASNTAHSRELDFAYDKNSQVQGTQVAGVPIDDPTKNGSFVDMPVTLQTLTTRIVYNVKKLKVAECDERNRWTFYVYDSEGKEVFKVLPTKAVQKQERNAFGEIERIVLFDDLIDIDLTQYQNTGIPLAIITAAMTPKQANVQNRSVKNERDNNGRVINQKTEGEVLYFVVNNGVTDYQKSSPLLQHRYNAFGEPVSKATLLSPNRWSNEFYWHNRAGKRIAMCNAMGGVEIYDYKNPFHELTGCAQWGGVLKQQPDSTTTYAQLLTYYQADPENPDCVMMTGYDLIGQKILDSEVNVIEQKFILSPPSLQDLPPETLVTRYVRNKLGDIVATLYPDGSIACKYYSSRRLKIAETGVPQKGADGTVRIPLTYYFYNGFGQEVFKTKFVNGTNVSQPSLLPPVPLKVDAAKDQSTLKLMDSARGKPAILQDAEGNLTGYTCIPTGDLGRTFHLNTDKGPANQTVVRLFEKRFFYDANKDPVGRSTVQDGVVQYKTLSQYNSFGEIFAEGFVNSAGKDTYYTFIYRDVTGKIWKTNHTNGVWTIMLRNLSGHLGLKATSNAIDLSTVEYADVLALLQNATMDNLQQIRIERDLGNLAIRNYAPTFESEDPNDPQNIPLSLAVGSQYPDIGSVSISWNHPEVTIVVPTMTIWPTGNPDLKAILTVKKSDTRFGIDVSHLPSDVYSYVIAYHLIDDEDGDVKYQTIGTLQCDTGNVVGSTRLVVDVQNDNTLVLTGNTTNITAINLFQDNVKVGNNILVPSNHQIDLSAYKSGIYSVQPVVTGQDNLPQTLPFTIYTNTPSDTPLSLELDSTFELKCLRSPNDPSPQMYYAELDWTISEGRYNNLALEVTFSYTFDGVFVYFASATLDRKTNLGQYHDSKGNVLNANIKFKGNHKHGDQPIPITILNLKVVVVVDNQNKITVCNTYTPTGFTGGDGYDIIRDFQFASTSTLFISPVTALVKLPAILYQDTSSGYQAEWKEIQAIGMTQSGFVLDVTGLVPGRYLYKFDTATESLRERHLADKREQQLARIEKREAATETLYVFTVARGSQIYSSTPILTSPMEQQAVRKKSYNTFGKITQTKNTLDYPIDLKYDSRKNLVETTYPEVQVQNSDGTTTKLRPVNKKGYNKRGFTIGRTDGNNHTTGFVVDEAGQPLKKILPDGTVIEQKVFNALQQMETYIDSRGKPYLLQYDRRNNVIRRQSPMEAVVQFWYNESGNLGSETDSANQTTYYWHDVNGNIVKSISPLSYITQYAYDLLTNKPISQINSDGTSLAWVVDPFGFVHWHRDLSGAEVFTEYNNAMQPIHVWSQGGNHGNMLSVSVCTGRLGEGIGYTDAWGTYYKLVVSPTPAQNMRYTYRQDGRLVGAFDLALTRSTLLILDKEGREIDFQAWHAGVLLRRISSIYDGLNRPTLTYGIQEIAEKFFDATTNIIRTKITLVPPVGAPVVDDSWNLMDAADRVLIYLGALVNKQIVMQPNKGWTYTFKDGLRMTQSYQDNQWVHVETLTYDDDSRINGSSSTDGFVTQRAYDAACRPTGFSKTFPNDPHGQSDSQGCTFDNDGRLITAQTATVTWEQMLGVWVPITKGSNTTYGPFNGYKMPTAQISTYTETAQDNVVDNLQNGFVSRDTPEESVVGGTRTDSDGTGPYNAAMNFQGPNPGEITGQSQSLLTSGFNFGGAATVLDQDCLKGLFLSKQDYSLFFGTNESRSVKISSFFYETLGNIIGSIQVTKSFTTPNQYGVGMNFGMPGVKGVLATSGKLSDVSTDFSIGKKMINPVDKSFPPMSSGEWVVKSGDTLEGISQAECQSTQAVSAISAANGGIGDSGLQNGMTIKIPELIQSKYQLGTTDDYNTLTNAVIANLYPTLIAAQPDDDDGFWDELIDVVIVVVAVAIGIATGGTASGVSAAMISAAVMEAGAEEGEIQLGMRQDFSWKAVLQIAIEAGFAEYAAAAPPALTIEGAVMSSGEISVEEQLTEMAFTGGHFDIREVLAQMVTAGIMYEVGPALQLAALKGATGPGGTLTEGEKLLLQLQLNFANTVASGISSAVFEGQKLDAQFFESMAAQFLGSVIGQGIVSETSVDHKIGDAIKAQVQAHPTIASIINDIGAGIGGLEEDLDDIGNAMDEFIKSEIISPQAQTPAPVVAPKKPSQARAMSRFGLHARSSQVQNYADANGNYIGAGLGLTDDPAIDNFDPYSDSGSNPSTTGGVSKVPTVRNNSTQLNTPNVMQGSSKTTFFQNALHELVNEIQEVATYIKPAGESFKASGEGYMGVGNNYSNLGSQLLKGFPNSESFATEGQSASEVEFEEMAQQISRVGAGYVALGLKMDGNGRALIAAGFGLQIKVAYDNVQAAPADLRTAMEVKEYGGIVFGAVGGVVGGVAGGAVGAFVARSPVAGELVGGLAGDLVGMSLWKGLVDDYEPQLAQPNANFRNSF